MKDPGDEIVTIVNECNEVVGTATRRRMRAEKLPHRSSFVLVFNARGELFVQRRTLTKDIFPGWYDLCAGGVVLDGETPEQGALRELEEELGIRFSPVEYLFDFYFADGAACFWGSAFVCCHEGEMTLQAEEIAGGTFEAIEDILDAIPRRPYTPDSLYVLKRYLRDRGPSGAMPAHP